MKNETTMKQTTIFPANNETDTAVIRPIHGGITAPAGFAAAGVKAGIKYPDRKDMALIYSEVPAVTAGSFTTNIVKAAPVLWDMEIVEKQETARTVIINAGIANACTGQTGIANCRQTAAIAAATLGVEENEVLLGSTGVIGMTLPMEKIEAGVHALAKEKAATIAAGTQAAEAIMTTDTVVKEAAVRLVIDGKQVTIGGMAKGAGMICPNMATLLSYVTTDANISKEALTQAVNEVVADTFNMITVDGDTSTNDTWLVLANGLAANVMITLPDDSGKNEGYEIFKDGLYYIGKKLAKMIAADGEGATTLISVNVAGADSKLHAAKLAKSVAGSNLVKAAVYGRDANWGRIICALGYAGVDFDPEKVRLSFADQAGQVNIYADGCGLPFDEEKVKQLLSADEVVINIDMGSSFATCQAAKPSEEGWEAAKFAATAWGCDLTEDYIKINADYRS